MADKKIGAAFDGRAPIEMYRDGHINPYIKGDPRTPAGSAENLIVVRWSEGDRFICARKDGKNIDIQLTRDELRLLGVACIRLASDWKPGPEDFDDDQN